MIAAHNTVGEVADYGRLFPSSTIKVIKLLGFSDYNKEQDYDHRYHAAKRPFMKGWQQMDKPGLTRGDESNWLSQGGWTGLVIPKGYIVIDIDEQVEGEILYKALLADQLNFHAIKTVRGYQFFFKDTGKIKGQDATVLMACGCVGDYRLAERGQIVLPSTNTKGREWIRIVDGELSEMPIYFNRLKKANKADRPFPIPMSEGGRNNALFSHASRLVEFGFEQDEIHEITSFLNKYFFIPPLEHREYIATLKSALQHAPSGKNYGLVASYPQQQTQLPQQTRMPIFNLTEMGNAERLVHYCGNNLRYCVEFEEWLIWDGKSWLLDKKRRIERVALKQFREMYKEAANEMDDSRRTELVKWAKSSEKSNIFLNSIARAQAMLPISSDELNPDKMLLNCTNGVIDLKTGQLLPHDRKYMMSQNTYMNYDPAAACPTWIKFLESIFKNDAGEVDYEVIEFLQKAVGYSLTGSTKEQAVFFLWGTGGNGKSTFINMITKILGDYAKQAQAETFTAKQHDSGINNDIARLHGSRFVSAVESEDGKRLSEALIKQLTGGEKVTARFLRKEFFEFLPEFKIFFTTNYKPIVKGDDEGIWRRIKLIPFNVKIKPEDKDPNLPDKLEAEIMGILRWAVDGCLKWQRDGLEEPETIKGATDEYKEEMDLLSNFISDCCIIHKEAKVKLNDIYKEYMEWCEQNGEHAMKKNKFSARMHLRGIEKRKSTGNQTFLFGIGLSSDSSLSYLVTDSSRNSYNPPIEKNMGEIEKKGNYKVTSNLKEETI